MAYSDTINQLREALNSYSEDEARIADLYETAVSNARKEYHDAYNMLDYNYAMERNKAYSDNARNERSYNQLLASRGLGFSGEAAQGKLNSNISLTNRLTDIGLERKRSAQELSKNYNDSLIQLKTQQADKLFELYNNKNKAGMDIAALELESENNQAKLDAEKALQDAKLKAEKEMFYAELNAKYNSSQGSTGSSNSGGSGNGSQNTSNKTEETGFSKYIPNISTESLAKQLVSSATKGEEYGIKSYNAIYTLNKFLVNLYDNYKVDQEYFDELIFMLGIHGFKAASYPEMRVQVISYEGKKTYDQIFDSVYENFLVSGMSEAGAMTAAKRSAMDKTMLYMYREAANLNEFYKCCDAMDIDDNSIREFLRKYGDKPISTQGSGGTTTSRGEQ